MRKNFCISLLVILSGSPAAQTNDTRNRNGSKTVFEGQPASIRLARHVTTTIRLPDPVNSVVVGDSSLFRAEYSPNEPLLVFARATASGIAQTNLVISTGGDGTSFCSLKALKLHVMKLNLPWTCS